MHPAFAAIVSLSAFGSIFTASFVRAIVDTIVHPFLMAYVVHHEKSRVQLPRGQVIRVGKFVTELLIWIILMGCVLLVWWVFSR